MTFERGAQSLITYEEFGWSVRGEKVRGEVSVKRFARKSFVAGMCEDRVMAPLCYQGTCNTNLFNLWVEHFLLPELRPGQFVVFDSHIS